MPIAELVELPRRGDDLGPRRTRQPLTARLPETPKRPEKRHVLGHETAFVIAADCLEVFLATERNPRVHSGHEDNRHDHRIGKGDPDRPALEARPGRSGHDAWIGERAVDLDKRVRMYLRIGVHEGEEFSACGTSAGVTRRRNNPFLHGDHAAAAHGGDDGGAIGRGVVGDDHLDGVAASVSRSRSVEEAPQQSLLVVGGNDQRVSRQHA